MLDRPLFARGVSASRALALSVPAALLSAIAAPAQLPDALAWKPPSGSIALETPEPRDWPAAAQRLPARDLTVAAWVRVDRFEPWTGIFSALQDNGDFEQGVLLGLRERRFVFGLAGRDSGDADGTITYLEAPTFAAHGRWAFVCGTYDGTTMRLHVDGQEVATSTAQRGDIWYPEDLRVAVNAYVDRNETHPLHGALAGVWLAPAAWDPEQITAALEATRGAFPEAPGLAATWEGIRALNDSERVGRAERVRVPTAQFVQPAGIGHAWRGRPVDLAVSPGGDLLAVKDNAGVGLFRIDGAVDGRARFEPLQFLPFPSGGGSMHGVRFSRDGTRLWATTAQNALFEAARATAGGAWDWTRAVSLPGPGGEGAAHGLGIAQVSDERLLVCLSRNNTLAEVDLVRGKVTRQIDVGVAPYDVVVLPGAGRAVVSNWGGRHPAAGERSAPSSGTPVLVDERGIARSGTVGLVDLATGQQIREVATGLHPADLLLEGDADRVYVANANSDTITILRASNLEVVATLLARPDPNLPYGSATNALALSDDGRWLFAANGGNNALAVFRRPAGPDTGGDTWEAAGFVPTGWYPGGIAFADHRVFATSVKGLGSRSDDGEPNGKRSVFAYTGIASAVDWPPTEAQLADWTDRVQVDARTTAALRATARREARPDVAPVPVPARIGEPSVIRHVVYVIKENRTYDQVLGDLPQGNGDPDLCIFPRAITPNHHALAEQFVLLDNFYCNGVNSADGHSWATEGNVTDHLEKSFGGFTRSYTFGDDPLTYSSTGFVWDGVLLAGLSFRNYGEMDYASPVPRDSSFARIHAAWRAGDGSVRFEKKIGIETLARHTCPDYPGWNMRIPDGLRADAFLAELAAAEKAGEWYDFMIVYLPQDHTSGLSEGMPTPAAHMADNDLALGRIVEGISQSRFWRETCIFVIEDDPQNGFDHVDGHRSLCFVVSPWARRGAVVHDFFNQTSVLHTMQRILGLPPMNQMDAMSPLMTSCFAAEADPAAYRALEPGVALDKLNASAHEAAPGLRRWYVATAGEDFEGFDRADEDTLNRILWHAQKGPDAPYPAHLAGAHGKGLKPLGLILTGGDDDDEDRDR